MARHHIIKKMGRIDQDVERNEQRQITRRALMRDTAVAVAAGGGAVGLLKKWVGSPHAPSHATLADENNRLIGMLEKYYHEPFDSGAFAKNCSKTPGQMLFLEQYKRAEQTYRFGQQDNFIAHALAQHQRLCRMVRNSGQDPELVDVQQLQPISR